MKGGYREDWNELARREPYFAVLTEDRFLRNNFDEDSRRAFFESGDADVEGLLGTLADTLGRPFTPATALDFGCGVGRLSIPLARRVGQVVGCDIANEMVAEATNNAQALGVTNATFTTRLDDLAEQRFDLIVSLIVFQHIPVREGLATLSRLLQLLSPGGVAAIHFTTRRPGNPLRRFARRLRAAIPTVHRLALRMEGSSRDLPYMQMNVYDPAEVARRIVEITGSEPRVIPKAEGAIEGALFVVERAGESIGVA